MKPSNSRRQLDALGRRRAKLRADDEKLAEDTRKAVEAARCLDSPIPAEEIAERVGLTRTTLYQVYLRDLKKGGRRGKTRAPRRKAA